jgi:hypothetical protein
VAISPQASVSVDGPVYLDQGVTVSGSGFRAFEPINVSIVLGNAGKGNPILGSSEANAGGAWQLDVAGPLTDISSVADNASVLTGSTVVTVLASGADGSKGSTPVSVVAELPVEVLEGRIAYPDTNLQANIDFGGAVETGGTVSVVGAGFNPKETVSLLVIKGFAPARTHTPGAVNEGGLEFNEKFGGTSFEYSGAKVPQRSALKMLQAEETGAFVADLTVGLGVGVYTIEGRGTDGSLATAGLVVTAAK